MRVGGRPALVWYGCTRFLSNTIPDERRRHVRTYVPIVATIYSDAFRSGVTCLVHNISIGGALFMSAPRLEIGTDCRVALSPIGAPRLEINSRVLRKGKHSDGNPWVAVEFVASSATDPDALEAMIARAVPAGRNRAVLVADGDANCLRQAAAEVEQRNLQPLLSSTRSQAIRWLESEGPRVVVALVGLRLDHGSATELLAWLGDDFPGLHRAVLQGPLAEGSLDRLLKRVATEPAPTVPWLTW